MDKFGVTYEYTNDSDVYYHVRAAQLALNHVAKQCKDRGIIFEPAHTDVIVDKPNDGKPGRITLSYRHDRAGLPI